MELPGPSIELAAIDDGLSALELLLVECDPQERRARAVEMLAKLPCDADRWSGLIVARRRGALRGVCLAELHRGRTGSLWRPRFVGADDAKLGGELVRAATQWLIQQHPRLVQALITPRDRHAARWLIESGFSQNARLAYLALDIASAPVHAAAPANHITTTAVNPSEVELLQWIVERSYEGTLDCPALNGVRTTAEVLEGYRELGDPWPERWRIAWSGERPVGCLLLADYSPSRQVELVYMAVLPEFRGHGWGVALVAEARRLTQERGRERLVLAADQQNGPALELYANCGFFPWDERDVFTRILDRAVPA